MAQRLDDLAGYAATRGDFAHARTQWADNLALRRALGD
jgi:hypothetical protein